MVLSLVVGFFAVWLVGIYSAVDTNPPQCWNRFGSVVPCERSNGLIFAVTLGVALLVSLAVVAARFRRLK